MLTLSRLVAEVESNNSPYAVRYESGWRYTTKKSIDSFHRAHRPVRMSEETVRILLASSWGKYQMMGSNLYDMGYGAELVQFASTEFEQDIWFKNFLQTRGIDFTLEEILKDKAKRQLFARRYNGDATTYSARLLNVYETLKRKI